jgi:Spy/CpxP family protein refolding chaperone
MKRWMSALLLSALCVTLTVPALAQGTTAPEKGKAKAGARGNRGNRMQALMAKLNLTAEQKTKLKAAQDANRAEVQKIRQAPGTREEKRPQMREARKAFMQKVNSILTAEQQKQLKEEMAKARAARGTRGTGKAAKKPNP